MTVAMDATYELDGLLVTLSHIDLGLDGFRSTVTGNVDLANWPEQTYEIVESDIDLPTMKDVFFAGDPFTVAGDAHMTGTWHIYDGGRDLTGAFESDRWALNGFDFPDAAASILWTDDRFEVFDYRSRFYEGTLDLGYTMAPLGADEPGMATLDTTLTDTRLSPLTEAVGLPGIRPRGAVSGRHVLRWPIGAFSDHSGEGDLTVTPPRRDGADDPGTTRHRCAWGRRLCLGAVRAGGRAVARPGRR